MSQENVDAVRRAWEAFEGHDNEAIFPLYDSEVEVQYPFLDRVYRGLPGVQEYFRDWLAVWDEFGSEVEEWIDAGDSVIAVMHSWGRGKQSGARVEERNAHVWTLRNGKLWRLRVYATRAEALKAVGLED
jgi:uncharacterized protein